MIDILVTTLLEIGCGCSKLRAHCSHFAQYRSIGYMHIFDRVYFCKNHAISKFGCTITGYVTNYKLY